MTSWYNRDWLYRKKITISGQNISGNLTDFPFLFKVSTTDNSLSSNAHSGGKDFIFTDTDGETRVHHEIENWQYGSGSIWVRIPTLTHNTNKTIYLYYGEGSDNTNDIGYKPSGTWNNNYISAWHMDDATTSTISDSTRNSNTGNKTSANNPLEITSGQIYRGQKYDGNDDDISVPHNANQDITSEATFEAWIRYFNLNNVTNILNKRDAWNSNNSWSIGWRYGVHDNEFVFEYSTDGVGTGKGEFAWYKNALTPSEWNYICVRYDKTDSINARFWINGTEQTAFYTTTPDADLYAGDSPIHIGIVNHSSPSGYYEGLIDEVRISNVARSTGWIKTSYSGMKSPSTFFYLASEESYSIDYPSIITVISNSGLESSTISNSGRHTSIVTIS